MKINKYKIFVVIFLVLIIGAVLVHGSRLIAMGAAYKAKMLCSEIFISGRDKSAALDDLVVDDLDALKHINVSVDFKTKTVTSSFLGIIQSKVSYRKIGGCTLVSNGVIPPSSGVKDDFNPEIPKFIQSEHIGNSKLNKVIDEAFLEPDPEHLRRTRAIVVLHNGQIVAEQYAAGIGAETPLLGWSMTKSVMNALVGTLIKSSYLMLDSPVRSNMWPDPSDPRHAITVRHLLNMSSGLKFNEKMTDPLADVSRMILQERDMAKFASDMPLEAEPGKRWQYSSGNTLILSEFIRRILGEEEYHRYPKKVLFSPMGMINAQIETDASGTFVGSSFMYATAQEWAKFGQLYLQDGVWEGKRILPKGWVKYTKTPFFSNMDISYGAHFWLEIPNEYRGNETMNLPKDIFHAVGHEGQFVTIVPSYNAVIVRLGKTRYSKAWEHDVFVHNVLESLN